MAEGSYPFGRFKAPTVTLVPSDKLKTQRRKPKLKKPSLIKPERTRLERARPERTKLGRTRPEQIKSDSETPSSYAALPITAFLLLLLAWCIQNGYLPDQVTHIRHPRLTGHASWVERPVPLVMQGGDPYIRALMRTISASESNIDQPYRVLYGGELVDDLSRHPDLCLPIVAGPNIGDCTTAAGRYQFLTTTWEAKAQKYHPKQPGWLGGWGDYSFKPEYQDVVVYHWLSDASAWGVDISELLREGRLDEVLQMLSGTWTSLGYGIETNSMSGYLPEIYQSMLQEELQNTGVVPSLLPGQS